VPAGIEVNPGKDLHRAASTGCKGPSPNGASVHVTWRVPASCRGHIHKPTMIGQGFAQASLPLFSNTNWLFCTLNNNPQLTVRFPPVPA
jgi:hypothetical protein